MEFLPYRRMVNVFLTEDEAKAEAAEITVSILSDCSVYESRSV